MHRPAPGATNSEETLVDGGAVFLVCGDDSGQDTAIHQELHAQVFIIREQVGFNDLLQNRFVSSKLPSKGYKSSSYLSQAITMQEYVLDIFMYVEILAGIKKTEAILILRPESAELFRSIPPRKKQTLNPCSLCLLKVSV